MSNKSYIVNWCVTKYYFTEVVAKDEEEAREEAFNQDPHHYEKETHDIEVDEVEGSEVACE